MIWGLRDERDQQNIIGSSSEREKSDEAVWSIYLTKVPFGASGVDILHNLELIFENHLGYAHNALSFPLLSEDGWFACHGEK